ncbi:MAG: VOC family protein [Nitrososphaeraceae archaeon]|jgi:catechol-2,3-dioxygenase
MEAVNPMIRKIVETCIYSSDLKNMKDFYVSTLGLRLVEESERSVFLKAGKSMLLIFNPELTKKEGDNMFPIHGAITPPAMVHFALEIEKKDYEYYKRVLIQNNIGIEKEIKLNNESKSLYFRDPAGNLVEVITKGEWPVED